ncbi:nicotinamide-nucleotide amidase [Salsuginibacillus halophilus]|uniref:Putative competence-damage inducible protein n=1 Tax=Salsuginibacillus halophilus TaxID=517424 RepID=A0A2P8HYJ8_9BACI|nr:competence/damage-inducible protein A [Salsuginibacillus halophilus]PSL51255.1 nicotinamide-nucleotide amidase [Salsuginibacillus halophilus]
MNAEVIAVGSELLLGQIANTNGQYVSRRLAEAGISVYRHTVVGDNENRLREAAEEAGRRADIVIFSGGLGPTSDDLTRDALARELNRSLIIHPPSLEQIEAFMKDKGKTVSAANERQAYILEGADPFVNRAGLACGMAVTEGDTLYLLLPGPPHELKRMIDADVIPYLSAKGWAAGSIVSRELKFFGIGESALHDSLAVMIEEQKNPTAAPLASEGEVALRLTARGDSVLQAEQMLDGLESKLPPEMKKLIYGKNDVSLAAAAVERLKQTASTVAVAESLTGGGVLEALTSIPGASSVVKGGAVTYQTEAKQNNLEVSEEIIHKHGVISAACAEAMAENVRKMYGASFGIALTGVAGPTPQEGEPAGKFYIGVASADGTTSTQFMEPGSRERVRLMATKHACHQLLKV